VAEEGDAVGGVVGHGAVFQGEDGARGGREARVTLPENHRRRRGHRRGWWGKGQPEATPDAASLEAELVSAQPGTWG